MYCIIFHYIILILYYIIYCIVLYYIILYRIILHYYYILYYCIVLYCVVLYYIIVCYVVFDPFANISVFSFYSSMTYAFSLIIVLIPTGTLVLIVVLTAILISSL